MSGRQSDDLPDKLQETFINWPRYFVNQVRHRWRGLGDFAREEPQMPVWDRTSAQTLYSRSDDIPQDVFRRSNLIQRVAHMLNVGSAGTLV